MKKAAKVFLIIGMCLTFYLVYPIVLGIKALKKLEEAKTTDDLRLWAILSIFFVSSIGGLLMLLLKQEDLNYNEIQASKKTGYAKNNDPSTRLLELKTLFDAGIIDKVTFDEKSKQVVKEL